MRPYNSKGDLLMDGVQSAATVMAIISIVIEAVFVPLFLRASKDTKNGRSLFFKMVASTMFLMTALWAVNMYGGSVAYSKLIVKAIMFGWAGDLFLGMVWPWACALGGVIFFVGHLWYVFAFIRIREELALGAPLFAGWEIAVIIALAVIGCGLILFFTFRSDLDKRLTVPVILYECMLCVMWVAAIAAAVGCFASGSKNGIVFGLLIITGSTLFKLSDDIILILTYGKVRNFPLRCVNIGTYYAAQTLLALSIAAYV